MGHTFRLKSIDISGWATIKQATVDFPRSGLVLITGRNKAVGSHFESVGSGKTSLGEALCRAIYGYPGRYSQLSHYAPSTNHPIHIKVQGLLGEEAVTVELGHRYKPLSSTGEGFLYTIGENDPVQFPATAETQRQFRNLIGLDPETVRWTVFVDGQRKIADMNQAQSVDLLMATLNLPSWSDLHSKSKVFFKKLKDAHSKIVTSLDDLERQVQDSNLRVDSAQMDVDDERLKKEMDDEKFQKDVEQAEQLLGEAQQVHGKAVDAMRARAAEVESERKRNEDERQVLKLRQKDFKKKLDDAQQGVTTASANLRESNSAVGRIQDVIDRAGTEQRCPTCKQPIQVSQADLESLQKDLAAAKELSERRSVEFAKAKDIRTEATQSYDQITAALQSQPIFTDAQLVELTGQVEVARSEMDQARTALASMRPPPNNLPKVEALLKERKERLADVEARLEKLKPELQQALEAMGVGQYWMTAFSPVGIPNQVLSRATELLNLTARSLAHRLTGGTLSVAYSTTRTLVSGETRCELQVEVSNSKGSARVAGASKGESGLINLVMVETLAAIGHVGVRAGFRFFDEVVNSTDIQIRRSIFAYLREMAHQEDILVFVTDHHPESVSFADHILVAVKDDQGTTYEWG